MGMRSLKEIALQYCAEHPEAKRCITAAGLRNVPPLSPPKSDVDIAQVILGEEERYWKLMERAKKIVSHLKREEMTGEKLCELHDTHGIDPTVVEDILGDLPSLVHDAYLQKRKELQELSRKSQKKTVITIV